MNYALAWYKQVPAAACQDCELRWHKFRRWVTTGWLQQGGYADRCTCAPAPRLPPISTGARHRDLATCLATNDLALICRRRAVSNGSMFVEQATTYWLNQITAPFNLYNVVRRIVDRHVWGCVSIITSNLSLRSETIIRPWQIMYMVIGWDFFVSRS